MSGTLTPEDDDCTRSKPRPINEFKESDYVVPDVQEFFAEDESFAYEIVFFKGSIMRAMKQVHSLVVLAKRFGATQGCTVTDSQTGLCFRWRPAPCSGSDS